MARRGTGSTGLSRRTHRFHPWGKCRVFPRKRFTFPRSSQGHRLYRPLSPYSHFHPRGKCREFPRKRFTFPRGRQGHRLHRHLWRHSPFPPPGKVPGFSAKTVHFPPWLVGVPAPQAYLAALTVSTLGESAGFFRENGSLSPAARRGTGSTGLSRRTRISTPGESAGNFHENGSLSPAAGRGTGSTGISGGTRHFHLRGKCRVFPRKWFTFPSGRWCCRVVCCKM